ncbi:MAG TPA: hypothetical protein VGO93_09535, partial [Candidatus Xenobia bacterium]
MVVSSPTRLAASRSSRRSKPAEGQADATAPDDDIRFYDKDGAEVHRKQDVNSPEALEAARKYASRLRKINDVGVVLAA